MTIVVAPGAFKHSIGARRATDAIARGLARALPNATLVLQPIADGGGGTLDVLLAADPSSQRHTLTVRDPLGRPVRADWGLVDNGRTAIIEMALASGTDLISARERNALAATTYGTGQLLSAALDSGAEEVIVGVGNSATSDGGAGALAALGVRFLDAAGKPLLMFGGGALGRVARVDASALSARWQQVRVRVATDVTNPVAGPDGAAAVYGPQKGATGEDVALLDANLAHLFGVYARDLGVDVHRVPGAGAAGALAGGLAAALGATLVPGAALVLARVGFHTLLSGARLVVTGEGRFDAQTAFGKGPQAVAQAARAAGVPVVALVGDLDADENAIARAGLDAALPIVQRPMPLSEALHDAEATLDAAAWRLGRLLALGGRMLG